MSSTPNSAPPAGQLFTLRGVAAALGLDPGQLSKESRRGGFPAHPSDQGMLYNPDEVRAWRQQNIRGRKSQSATALDLASPATSIPAAAAPLDRPTRDLPMAAGNPPRRQAKPKRAQILTPQPAMPPGPAPAPASSPQPAMLPGTQTASGTASPPPSMPPIAPAPSPNADPDDADLLAILRSRESSALDISRAMVQLVARKYAAAHARTAAGPHDIDAVKKALTELRTAESAYLELQAESGRLIPLDDVRMIVADCAARLARIASQIENTISLEFAAWLVDPAVTSMNADDRARKIRAFVSETTRALRIQEADSIDKLIADGRKLE